VGPDNGIFTSVLNREQTIAVMELINPEYRLPQSRSTTFHGRDIFAPVSAYLAMGTPILKLGREIDPATLTRLDMPAYSGTESDITGYIQYIDRFGNCITTIPGAAVQDRQWYVTAADHNIPGHKTYGDTQPGNLLALEGSHGFIEIAVNGGNAQSALRIGYRSPVRVVIQ
jgi:S-adenosylmethionine hydrolase